MRREDWAMPIVLPYAIKPLQQSKFQELDYQVMGYAFGVHNALGRHLEEKLYEDELSYRLRAAGVAVHQQFPVVARFGDYATTLWIDMLVGESTVYELKTVRALAPAHRAQALSYLFLTQTHHGKVINFGTSRVESEFVSTQLAAADRSSFNVDDRRWVESSPSSRRLKAVTLELAKDWGLCLECGLYRGAVIHALAAQAFRATRIELVLDNRIIGSQEVDLLDPDTLVVMSSHNEQAENAERHLARLLDLSQRRFLHWINFQRHAIQFVTLACMR